MSNIDFWNIPYDHSGRWKKEYESIWNERSKVTWPQLLAEYTIWWRSKLIRNYPQIERGPKWSRAIAAQVKRTVQQCHNICNYFPHPDDEPLVIVAFKNYWRSNRITQVGAFRKNRLTKEGRLNISDAEKDLVKGLNVELNRLLKQRNSFMDTKPVQSVTKPKKTKKKEAPKSKKGGISGALSLEKDLGIE